MIMKSSTVAAGAVLLASSKFEEGTSYWYASALFVAPHRRHLVIGQRTMRYHSSRGVIRSTALSSTAFEQMASVAATPVTTDYRGVNGNYNTDDDRFGMDQQQLVAYGFDNSNGVADDWSASNNFDNIHQAFEKFEVPSMPKQESKTPDNGPSRSVRTSRVMTGRERRASWESYAIPGMSARHIGASNGGEIGSPSGMADWRYSSSYGPATTTPTTTTSAGPRGGASSSSLSRRDSVRSSPSPSKANDNASSSANNNNHFTNRRSVMTGRERRATFDSFSPFAPAHEQPERRNPASAVVGPETRDSVDGSASTVGSTLPNEAEDVAATLSSLSSPSYNDFASPPEDSVAYSQEDARDVASALSGLSFPTYNDFASPDHAVAFAQEEEAYDDSQQAFGGAIVQDTPPASVEEVPMDTPARQSLPSYLSLHPIPGKGLGVITNKAISIGEFIGNYEGEQMTEEVKDRRYLSSLQHTLTQEDREWIQRRLDRGQTLTGCYLYGVDLDTDNIYQRFGRNKEEEEEANSSEPKNRIYIDAEDEYESLWTRFINHASPPYNNINPKSVPESYDGQPRVWFMANRDIEVGEELCFDYGDDYWLEGDEVF